MQSSLEDVEFLARSGSRVEVLDALRDSPRSRGELKDLTDASRTTLSRMLADFEERGWIERSERPYRLTAEGAFVAREVTRLLENMETATHLDGALGWLPTEEFDFDLRRLRDAEVVTLEWTDPASMRMLAERVDGADRVRSIASSVSREVVDILRQVTVDQNGTYEGILTADTTDVIRAHPELSRQLFDILETSGTTVYEYRGEPDLAMVMLIDDWATVCNHASDAPELEALITEDEGFRNWAATYFESVRKDAVALDADAFAD